MSPALKSTEGCMGHFVSKFLGVPRGVDPWRLGCKERTSQSNWWWNYFRIIPTYVIINSQSHNVRDGQTDGRTDGQTTCNRKTALCTKVHRAVKFSLYNRITTLWNSLPGTLLQHNHNLVIYCLSNAIHCMGQNTKSLAACVCVRVCAHGIWGPNISKTVRDRGLVTMGHQ